MNTNCTIIINNKDKAILRKVDVKKPWNNNDCSDKALLKILQRCKDKIKRVQFVDVNHIADELEIYF